MVQNFAAIGRRSSGISQREKKLKIWGKAQHESARCRKSDFVKNSRGKIPMVAKSRGPYSNVLADAERAMSTKSRSNERL